MTTALSKADESKLQKHLEAIDKAKAGFTESVLTIGRELCGIREIVDSTFADYVEEHCNFSRSTAYNYIAAFESFGNFRRIEFLDARAVYLLAPKEPAAKAAKDMANRGQHIDEKTARAIIAKYKKRKGDTPSVSNAVGQTDTNRGVSENGHSTATPDEEEIVDAEVVSVTREPGDDTESEAAAEAENKAKRRQSGKEKVSAKERSAAKKAFGVVVRLVIDKLGRQDARPHLEAIAAIIEGKA